jgi:ankyrin repeat protein
METEEDQLRELLDAIVERRPLAAIRTIVERHSDPERLLRTTTSADRRRGYLPLHSAVQNDAPLDVVKYLVAKCPIAVRIPTYDGALLPLHIALQDVRPSERAPPHPNFGIIKFLVEQCRLSLQQLTASGSLPLHLALEPIKQFKLVPFAGMEIVRYLAQEGPEALNVKDGSCRCVPLHYLLRLQAGLTLRDVAALVEACPESLQATDENGRTPLHLAASNDAVPLDVLRYLVAKDPLTIKIRCRTGETPLLRAVRAGAPVENTQFLVSQWPESAQLKDSDGKLPLHDAVCEWQPSVRTLVETWPPSLQVQDDRGWLPLHHVANSVTPEDVAPYLVERWPESVRVKDVQGRLPLHLAAAQHGPGMPLVRILVEAGPESVHEPDNNGWLPVHVALSWSITEGVKGDQQYIQDNVEDVVQYLIEQSPRTLRVADKRGRLPLHCAAGRFDSWLEIVQVLVEHGPDAVRERDVEGRLPVHAALSSHCSFEIGQFLAMRWPGSLLVADNQGRTPMHIAVSDDRSSEMVPFLATQAPQSLRKRDSRGNLPLHVALDASLPLPTLRPLVANCPESLLQRNANGLLPVQVAIAQDDPPMETILYLLEQGPAALQARDAGGELVLHFALKLGNRPVTLIRFLVRLWHDAVQVRDGRGYLPFQIAAAKRRSLEVVYFLVRARPELVRLGRTRKRTCSERDGNWGSI